MTLVKSIATFAITFFGYIISVLASVSIFQFAKAMTKNMYTKM